MTHSKNGERRLKQTIQELKAEKNRLERENFRLREELKNLVKPVRPRKEHVEQKSQRKMTETEWRLDFIRRHKPGVEKLVGEISSGVEKEDEET